VFPELPHYSLFYNYIKRTVVIGYTYVIGDAPTTVAVPISTLYEYLVLLSCSKQDKSRPQRISYSLLSRVSSDFLSHTSEVDATVSNVSRRLMVILLVGRTRYGSSFEKCLESRVHGCARISFVMQSNVGWWA
jgi:hypothetical protein